MTRTFELNVALCFHGKPLSCLLVAAGTLEASLLPCIGLHVGEIGAGTQLATRTLQEPIIHSSATPYILPVRVFITSVN